MARSWRSRTGLVFKFDPAASARSLVAELGGLDAVLAEEDKLRQVVQQLDVGDRVTIETVSLLLSSHLDKGPHRHIRQPDLRLFWRQFYAGESEVPWFEFWTGFPRGLMDSRADVTLVDELGQLLANKGAQEAFKGVVERSNPETVSVWELKGAFNGDEGLLEQVSRMLMLLDERAVVAKLLPLGARYQLPPLVANYMGRDEEGAEVLEHLLSTGSLALLAPGGMGKSCLAADVGWQIVRRGWAPGGALWVDLRGASSAAAVEARFCAALGLQQENSGNSARILAAVKALLPRPLPAAAHPAEAEEALKRKVPPPGALLVVDNAEDALLAGPQEEGAAEATGGGVLLSLLLKIRQEAPAARLLVTSRTALGLTSSNTTSTATATPSGRPITMLPVQHVGAIGLVPATQLVRAVAADLTEAEAGSVAAACHCVPLVLDLVAHALVAGRLALLIAAVQLTVFPSAFDEEAAASILGVALPQAQATLALLYRHSVLLHGGVWAGGGGHRQFTMHMVVRQQAMQVGRQLDITVQLAAEGCLIASVLGLLSELAVMYRTAKQWRLALAMARDRQADISRMLELVGGSSSGGPLEGAAGLASSASMGGRGMSAEHIAAALTDMVLNFLYELGTTQGLEAAQVRLLAQLGTGQQENGVAGGLLLYMGSWLLLCAGRGMEAEPLSRQALELRRRVLGEEHPDTASSVSSLASCIQDQGRYVEAEPLHPQALELQRQVLGEEHPDTASSINNLAGCIQEQGRYVEAEPLHRQALELRRQVLGEEHPDTASSINNLAGCIQEQGRYVEAEPLYRQALELRRRVLGEKHPDTASSINNLAICIQEQGRYVEAEPLHRQALELRRQVLGEEHPDTATSINNLASCIKAQGRYVEAEPLYQQALELLRRLLGEEHPDTASSINNLAGCIQAQGRYVEAEPLYRQALELLRRLLGEEHPDTTTSINNLARCIKAQGRYVEAEPLYRQALELRRRVLGEKHPDTASSINNLAICIQEQGRYVEAEPLHRQALELRRQVLGEEHPDTATSINNLASCIQEQGRYVEAEPLYRQALELLRRLLVEEHPDTTTSINNLARCIKAQGRYVEVEPLYRLLMM
ncbi:Nephrocystin-3 [Tetrabaena socialis]|uniref:Nephrocystin-3 n=1 Tax=Tetrabaena socialis TaxID=47790 RepID=A0A2J8ACV4_9CHLO|nr:Nephrocystin-3 [Tetrabaena socialis]|eukprot:PNH10349.1 Nephrocystin-3 [Tetrabaena socialis]